MRGAGIGTEQERGAGSRGERGGWQEEAGRGERGGWQEDCGCVHGCAHGCVHGTCECALPRPDGAATGSPHGKGTVLATELALNCAGGRGP